VAESSSSSVPALEGLAVETVEWLPSGAESGLVRVRGRWIDEAARQPELPVLALRAAGAEHRFDSLPDARFSRDPASWRGTYLVPAALVAADPEALWLEWAGGVRAGLPTLSRGVEPPPVPGAARSPEAADEPGGEVIDRAVLAERRARRAEAAERQQARVAAEAVKAVEVLELRSAELERRLEEATAERDALRARETEADERRGALSAALASAADLRSRSREWQALMRTHEVLRAGDSVRLAVLESERATTAPALRAALDEATAEAASARAALTEAAAEAASARAALTDAAAEAASARAALTDADGRFAEARAAWDRRRADLEAELTTVRAALDEARALEAAVAAAEARLQIETVARTTLEDELDRERATHAAAADDLHAQLDAARATSDGLRADLYAAQATADGLRAELHAAHDATADLRAELEAARAEAAGAADLRAALEAARAEAAGAADLRAALEAARAEAATTRRTADDLAAALDSARSETAAERGSADTLRAELELARSAATAARAAVDDLRAELDAERSARRLEGKTLQDRIAELERSGREQLERLAREHAAAAAAQPPAEDSTRMVADLDAAAEALRRRTPEPVAPDAEPAGEEAPWPAAAAPADPAVAPAAPAPEQAAEAWAAPVTAAEPVAPDAEPAVEWSAPSGEPAAPDCEPAVEWSEVVESPVEPVEHAVEPRRSGPDAAPVDWAPPGFTRAGAVVEPPAPDAEPYVEWAPPETARTAPEPVQEPPPAPAESAPPPATVETVAPPAPAESAPPPAPAGPRIVSAPKPPPRALMLGTEKRDYPLLRGAIVKLAHDDPALAGRVLAALLPAQGAVIEGPLAYDLTIAGVGTYGIAIAGGRAFVEPLEHPRGRHDAEFHLTAEPLILAELLAGVEHRIGRFFGPARVRGRKRRVKALQALPAGTRTLADAARAGAGLSPELVYRTFAYAVHPSWTRGHTFTVAQAIVGDPPETWYLTAGDGGGVSVSATPPFAPPAATVTMTRDTFDRLVRGDLVPAGQLPVVRGDRGAVALMHSWTEQAR
jgi:hypothetical protein